MANLLDLAMTSIAAETELPKTPAGELVRQFIQVTPPGNDSEAVAIATVRSELDKRAADDKFSGAVLIAKDGQPLFEVAYGYADRAKGITNTVDTNFRFGSMGKMFTALAVLQLAQADKIDLNAPIAKYLPDYPNQEVAAVTVYQLLTHTGGTGDIFTPEYEVHQQELKELKDYLVLYGKRGVEFKPGTSVAIDCLARAGGY